MHMEHRKIDRTLSLFVSTKYKNNSRIDHLLFSEGSLVTAIIMGKGSKHNNSKSRNNGIFKVAGQNFKNEKKGKPKEVTSKLKLVSSKSSFILLVNVMNNIVLDFQEK